MAEIREKVINEIPSPEYLDAQAKLFLEVRESEGDPNVVSVRGEKENLRKIFHNLIDMLASRKHSEEEVVTNWRHVCDNKQLRPGGTFMVTVKETDDKPEMIVMLVNDRGYQPFIKEMKDSIKYSIITASANKPI